MSFISRYFINLFHALVMPLTSLVRHFSLFILLVRRDLVSRTSGTILGKVWPLVQPTLQILGYWFVFDIVFSMRANRGPEYLEYLLTGMMPWLCVAEVLNRSTNMLREYGPLYRRNPFPLEILPFLVMAIPTLVYGTVYFFLVFFLQGFQAAIVSLLVVPMLMLWILPLSFLFSILGLFIKDFTQAIGVILMVTMFTTPILYFPDMLPESIQKFIWINPFSDLLVVVHGLIQGMEYSWINIVRPIVIWLILLAPCWIVYRRSFPHIREVL